MITHFPHHFLDSYEPGLSYSPEGYESGLAARTPSRYTLLIHFVFIHVSISQQLQPERQPEQQPEQQPERQPERQPDGRIPNRTSDLRLTSPH